MPSDGIERGYFWYGNFVPWDCFSKKESYEYEGKPGEEGIIVPT